MSGAIPDAGDGLPASHLAPPVGESPVERLCKWASEAALVIRLVVSGTDIFTRVKTADGWKISGGSYTIQRTGCTPSPLGPVK